MSFTNELKNIVKTAGGQLISGSTSPNTLQFTKNFYLRAKQYGLSEADAADVYYHGSLAKGKQNMMTKEYNGYSIGIYYFLDKRTGQPVISSIWKQNK